MLEPTLKYRYKLHQIQKEAIATMCHTVDLEAPVCGPELLPLIDVFDTQIKLLVPSLDDHLGSASLSYC